VLLASVAQGLVRFDPAGQIEPGLAERWNVSNDGLSYIFRLAADTWPNGRKINAADVARLLRRQLAEASRNPLKDTVGAVAEVVAMTDRVLEIRLIAPRPHLLELLAQPEFAMVRAGEGSGPFTMDRSSPTKEDKNAPEVPGTLRLSRQIVVADGDEPLSEHVWLSALPAEAAVKHFVEGKTALVLGGTFADLGVALGARLTRGALRFDPVLGLFGLAPARGTGPIADPELRALLDAAIDRPALVAALGVPDLQPRTSLLQPGLDGMGEPAVPSWAGAPLETRRDQLLAGARTLFGDAPPTLGIALPEGPGAEILLQRLRTDWGALGIRVERAGQGQPADLRLIDQVAPSGSPAWFLRQFRCGAAPVCVAEATPLLEAARTVPDAIQRAALLAETERQMASATLFISLAAPVRWSLTRGIANFVENRFARHPLTNLRDRPQRRD
jgi:peptide/nickel transport system substrate-binding protein